MPARQWQSYGPFSNRTHRQTSDRTGAIVHDILFSTMCLTCSTDVNQIWHECYWWCNQLYHQVSFWSHLKSQVQSGLFLPLEFFNFFFLMSQLHVSFVQRILVADEQFLHQWKGLFTVFNKIIIVTRKHE